MDCDLAVGDNYTDEYKDELGSSCVIVRTERGENIFEEIKAEIENHPVKF